MPANGHYAESVGHSSSNQPAGRFQRIRSDRAADGGEGGHRAAGQRRSGGTAIVAARVSVSGKVCGGAAVSVLTRSKSRGGRAVALAPVQQLVTSRAGIGREA